MMYRSSIIDWVEVKLISNNPNWWYIATTIKTNLFAISDTLQHWYPLPILAQQEQKINIIKPRCFSLYNRLIHNTSMEYKCYTNCYSFWIEVIPALVRPCPTPAPCTRCGWYCNQSCLSYSGYYDFVLQ